MITVPDIFRKSLEPHLIHGQQTILASKSGLTLSKVNKIVTGELKGSEDDRRKIAAALGYDYEAFLDLGRRALGLPVSRKADPPPSPEVTGYLDQARAVLEGGGKKAETLRNMLDLMKE